MHWDSFHFSCRYLSKKLFERLDLTSAQNSLLDGYHEQLIENPLESEMYRRITSSNNLDKQQELFSIYGDLNLKRDNSSINRLSNIRNYIFLVFAIFLVLSTICLIYVVPTFREMVYMMDVPISEQIDNFTTYWVISLTLMIIVSYGVLKLYSIINQLNSYTASVASSTISRFLLTNKSVLQIQKIEAYVNAPIGEQLNQFSEKANAFVTNLKRDNLNVAKELQLRIDNENAKLSKLLNSRIEKLMFLLAAVVVVAIYNFVSSLYAPLFYIGNIQ